MNYLADSTAKLCQGGKGRYVDREGVPADNYYTTVVTPSLQYGRFHYSPFANIQTPTTSTFFNRFR